MDVKKDIRFRVYIAFTCVCLFGIAIIVKAAMVQVKEGPELIKAAKNMHMRNATLLAERGNIYTEQGDLLCSTIPKFDAHVDFSVIDEELFQDEVKGLSDSLAKLFGDRTSRGYEKLLRSAYKNKRQNRYWLLAKSMQYHQYQELRNFPIFNKGKNRGGLIVESKSVRVNPYGILAYRTVGLWRENAKTVGLEATFDSVLNGVSGRRLEQKMTGGLWMPIEGTEIEPVNGRDIVTTIDVGIQDIAENSLRSILEKYECLYGTCVVMEVATGKVRALANLGRQKDGSYWEDYNYAMMPTEPGSTFKLMTLLALLNDKHIQIEDKVDAEGGAIRFGNLTMKDSHLGLGSLTIKDAFAHSSNAAMAKLAHQYYSKDPEQFIRHVCSVGLDKPTGIDVLGEKRTLVKTPDSKSWSKTTLPWMATGYEVLITPLHTCMLYNAVANNGKMMKPYLVSEVREYGKTIERFSPTVVVPAIGDSSTVAQLQACVEEVGLTGTAKGMKSPFYQIAGKTGTAQVADKGIKYSDRVYQGSFVGYFPADNPKYTIAVVVRTKPHSRAYYGGTVAAPVFRMIADKVFADNKDWSAPVDSMAEAAEEKELIAKKADAKAYKGLVNAIGLKVPVVGDGGMAQLTTDSSKEVKMTKMAVVENVVPDVVGMSLRDAIFLLEQSGMKVQIDGSGDVLSQSIEAGENIIQGRTIVLRLG
ncbi:MAG: penicillin-binding protein [Flavipsychrobacter sp.]